MKNVSNAGTMGWSSIPCNCDQQMKAKQCSMNVQNAGTYGTLLFGVLAQPHYVSRLEDSQYGCIAGTSFHKTRRTDL